MEQITLETSASAPKKRQRKSALEQTTLPEPRLTDEVQKELPKELSPEQKQKQTAEQNRLRLRREWEAERQMVTGVFRDLEVGPGGNIRFSVRKYPWDPIGDWHFIDGQTYTIPLWLARHLNEDCKYPVYRHNVDPSAKEGEKVKQIVGQYNHRFAFVSSEFIHVPKTAPLYVPHTAQ